MAKRMPSSLTTEDQSEKTTMPLRPDIFMKISFAFPALLLAISVIAHDGPHYELTVTRHGDRLLSCGLIFRHRIPEPAEVGTALTNALLLVASESVDADIIGSARFEDWNLRAPRYPEGLVYKASLKRILSSAEFDELEADRLGLKTTRHERSGYVVVVRERLISPGSKEQRKSLSVDVVFAEERPRDELLGIMVKEIEPLLDQKIEITAFAKLGKPDEPEKWRQIPDVEGGFVFADYNPKTDRIMAKEKVLK